MTELLHSIIEGVKESGAKSVFGEVVAAHGRTIIPVASIGYGFGGGGFRTGLENGGGGGGVRAVPVGVFEVTEAGTTFIPLQEKRKLAAAALIGVCVGLLLARRH
jgi:uncharacterized spore protein YtfJ